MSGNLLSIGKTGLYAAQAGLSTTGHNIANANVAGYNRQVVVQATAPMLDKGYGFQGTGTQVSQIKRYTDEFLNGQVRTAQASSSALESYHAQISQIDNMLADPTSGLSPSMQDFFKGVQDMAANRASVPSRQSMLSASESLAGRFQALDARLGEIREGVNRTVESSVSQINAYASQIAELNRQISSFAAAEQNPPNDLLDQRNQLVLELNTQVKATVTQGDANSLTISIGSGQPLVVGQRTFELAAVNSAYDPTRLEVGYVTAGGATVVLGEAGITGGQLGGALEFRSKTLDPAQSALGKVAIGLAVEFNAQHQLGLDQNGQPGGDFFNVAKAWTGAHANNASGSDMQVEAIVRDPSQLVDSDYKVEFNGTGYDVVRLSDNTRRASNYIPATPPEPLVIDGIAFDISGGATAVAGDEFLVRPTYNGAGGFEVKIKDVASIAAAAPIATSASANNTGNVKISEGKVDASFLGNAPALPLTLRFDGATGTLAGLPAGLEVTVTSSTGAPLPYDPAAGLPYTDGATYTFGGISITLKGKPDDGDSFGIAGNAGGIGDVRNIGLLGDLQTKNIFNGHSTTLQSSYAQLVSTVGNKTREVQLNAAAGATLLAQVQGAAQNVSGVNLDEEAANLIKYQQAYQAAGKIMQIAGTLFDTILSIGR